MLELLIAWLMLLLALMAFAIGRFGNAGALTLAYFLSLSVIHVPGVLPFVVSTLDLEHRDEIQTGFELTVLGLAAFVGGSVWARYTRRRASKMSLPLIPPHAFERLGLRTIAMGAVTYFVLMPLSFRVPSLNSVVSGLATAFILGFWLTLYGSAAGGNKSRTIAILALLPFLPLATLITGGFLGAGIFWVLSIFSFLFVLSRQRILFFACAPVVMYLSLSLFVTYMEQRADIRELVWREESTVSERLVRVSAIFTQFTMLDLGSPFQVGQIEARLNQNYLVGMAVARHESGWSDFAYGATLPVWGLIPRAIWPDKPEVAGGHSPVSEFTGIQFMEGTSVGMGQVMEFYINFGIPGLVIGFVVLGFILMRLDQGIMDALDAGDARGIALRALPGLSLLQPGDNLLEIVVAAAAAFFVANLLIRTGFFSPPAAAARPQPG
jgi:hypothetical protein